MNLSAPKNSVLLKSGFIRKVMIYAQNLTNFQTVIVVLLFFLVRWNAGLWRWNFIDLGVYTRAGRLLVHNQQLYATSASLPFTYPPFAAALFVTLYVVGGIAAKIVITSFSLGFLTVILSLCKKISPRLKIPLFKLVVAAILFEPVTRTLRLGQINIVLAGLIMLDMFSPKFRRRGYIVGLAAAVKLTPAAFIIFFALKRQWGDVIRAASVLVFCTAAGFLLAPQASSLYWTKLFYDPSHIGGIPYVDNQSLVGAFARVSKNDNVSPLFSVGFFILGLGFATLVAWMNVRAGDELGAFCSIGIGALLASPIAWSHHWIWIIPVSLLFYERRRYLTLAITIAIGYLGPFWFTPYGGGREFHDNLAQLILSNSFCIAGIITIPLLLPPRRNSNVGARGHIEESR